MGRNADFFNPEGGKLMKTGSNLSFQSVHLHANGAGTRARLDVGFKFHPRGYEPTVKTEHMFFGNGVDLDIEAMDAAQTMEAYFTLPEHARISIFEPHMHAPGYRMCLEAIWGITVETLNCAGYDHSWVRVYTYEDDAAPLLPKGTILRITGYFNNSPSNPNVPDPRNWSGGGHRSVDQMFINLMRGVYLTEEEFQTELEERRQTLRIADGDTVIGCPQCGAWVVVVAAGIAAGLVIEQTAAEQSRPRRNRFLFRIRVPADFGEKELVWTLTRHGITKKAYGTLKPDYFMDNNVMMANNGAGISGEMYNNIGPELELDGAMKRTAKVNQPVTLTAIARDDDGLPKPRAMRPTNLARPSSLTPTSATGLRLSWFVYRGPTDVTFDPKQIKAWEDTRANSNSPWGAGWETPPPPDGNEWVGRATFSKPGTYVLRCIAHDGGRATYEDVTFEVGG